MVTTPTGTTATATPGRVSTFPARHGQHAAYARQQPWRALSAELVRDLRTSADAEPRACRRALPRWHVRSGHRELTSGRYAEAGATWIWRVHETTGERQPVLKGSRSRVAWSSRSHYLAVDLALVLAESGAGDVLKAHHVDAATFLRWARTESLYADQSTGRRVIVRAVTVALLMEVSERTVQRCRAVGRALACYVTVDPGRMLNQLEQVQARFKGSPQRGLAAESAFVIPRSIARRGVMSSLHRGPADGQFSANPDVDGPVQPRGEKEPTPSARTNKRRRRASAGYRLAQALAERLSWVRGCPPKELAAVLHRFAAADPCWTVDDVVRHIDRTNQARGWSALSAGDVRTHPGAVLAKYLPRDLDPVADHPRMDLFLAEERRQAALAARRARRAHAASGGCGVPSCPAC